MTSKLVDVSCEATVDDRSRVKERVVSNPGPENNQASDRLAIEVRAVGVTACLCE